MAEISGFVALLAALGFVVWIVLVSRIARAEAAQDRAAVAYLESLLADRLRGVLPQ